MMERFDGNFRQVNYQPNSFDGPIDGKQFSEPPLKISGVVDCYDQRIDNDDYIQPGNLYV